MKSLLLKNIIQRNNPAGKISLLIEDAIISKILFIDEIFEADETLDLKNAVLFAGFIDIHNHGAVGVDVNTATANDLRKVGKFLALKGITAWLPTFVPDAYENYRKG